MGSYIGPGNTGQAERNTLDPAEVMARPIQIELGLGDFKGTPTCSSQIDQGQRIDLQQADMFGQLVFVAIVLVIRKLHPLDVQQQRLA